MFSLMITPTMLTAYLALSPTAKALCTPAQWQANPDRCQQIFQDAKDNSAAFGRAVCNLVGQEPTPHGIWAANSYLLSEQTPGSALNYGQMQDAIGGAISYYCPQYNSIYTSYRATYP